MAQKDPELKASIPFAFSAITYCAEGVKNDFQKVVDRFLSTDSVRYEDFLSIWQDMHIYHIFRGRERKPKLKEFTEECLKLACELWIESADFQVQVCGLYLLYGLYNTQPVEPKSRIRMTLPMWQTVQEFIKSVKEYKHLDVEFVYMKLLVVKAFHFVATQSNQNVVATPDYRRQKLLNAQDKPQNETATMIQNLLEPDNFLKLEVIDQQYQQMKKNLSGGQSSPDPSLSVIQTDLLEQVAEEVKGFKGRRLGAINAPVSEAENPELSLQAQLKQKAQSKRAHQRLRSIPKAERKSRYKATVDENAMNEAVLAALKVQPTRFDSMMATPLLYDESPRLVVDEGDVNAAKSSGKKSRKRKSSVNNSDAKSPRKKSTSNGNVEENNPASVPNGITPPKKRGRPKKLVQIETQNNCQEQSEKTVKNGEITTSPRCKSPAKNKRNSLINGEGHKSNGSAETKIKSPKGKAPMKGAVQKKRKSQT